MSPWFSFGRLGSLRRFSQDFVVSAIPIERINVDREIDDNLPFESGGADRRKEERRKEDLGPPPGKPERRLFDRRAQGTTTGQLLVEVGRFAAENMLFRQKGNKAAARRARKHLSLIMKLAKQRRAEISAEARGLSASSAAAETTPDDDDDDGVD